MLEGIIVLLQLLDMSPVDTQNASRAVRGGDRHVQREREKRERERERETGREMEGERAHRCFRSVSEEVSA
jgi:hypothetical protein